MKITKHTKQHSAKSRYSTRRKFIVSRFTELATSLLISEIKKGNQKAVLSEVRPQTQVDSLADLEAWCQS